eukprot:INCI12607.1.p1 GENE.INCI12607.1~~INCI12607.1.p1  ORF type:complete len:237 (+),score=30.95 INCI12607.1:232-942(+)
MDVPTTAPPLSGCTGCSRESRLAKAPTAVFEFRECRSRSSGCGRSCCTALGNPTVGSLFTAPQSFSCAALQWTWGAPTSWRYVFCQHSASAPAFTHFLGRACRSEGGRDHCSRYFFRVGSASAGTQLEAADVGVTEESVQHDIAALHHPETGEEVRVDPADGHLHTMSGFIDFYGRSAGMQRWVDAPRTLEELAFVSAEADSSMALGDDPSAVGNSHGEELTFSVSELKEMMAGGM